MCAAGSPGFWLHPLLLVLLSTFPSTGKLEVGETEQTRLEPSRYTSTVTFSKRVRRAQEKESMCEGNIYQVIFSNILLRLRNELRKAF